MSDNLYLQPKEISQALINIGEKKAIAPVIDQFIYGILAGIYISFGAIGAIMIQSGGTLDAGIAKLLAGCVFSVGLMLILIPGAELFTGNILMTIGLIDKRYKWTKVLMNWFVVYFGNFIGCLFIVWLMQHSGILGSVGATTPAGDVTIEIASMKLSLPFYQEIIRGILCNMLVCLAVIMCISSTTIIGKIFGIFFPIMAFVLSGFEHSIANMYFIPSGLAMKGEFYTKFFTIFHNLIPVTIGNIIGGLVIVLLHPKTEKELVKFIKNK